MASNPENKEGCLFHSGIGVGWLVLWYLILSSKYASATAGVRHCGFLEFGSCRGPWAEASGAFSSGMLIALISIPLPIYVVKRVRRALDEQADRNAQRRSVQEQSVLDARRREELERIAREAQAQKGRINRGEFIQRLGAANQYLESLPFETDPARQQIVRQGVSTELQKIVESYTLKEIAEILRTDDAIRIKAESMLESLRLANIRSSDGAVIASALTGG